MESNTEYHSNYFSDFVYGNMKFVPTCDSEDFKPEQQPHNDIQRFPCRHSTCCAVSVKYSLKQIVAYAVLKGIEVRK